MTSFENTFQFFKNVKMSTSEVVTSHASGNTKPEASVFKCPKKRAFQLTFNENAVVNCMKAVEYFKNLKTCSYLICCKEYNKAGNEHCHLYVHFNNTYAIPTKLIEQTKMHIEIAYASPKQNIEYVRKTGKWAAKGVAQRTEIMEEYGDEPRQGQLTIKELREIDNSDDLPDWKQYNVWKQVKSEHKKTKVKDWHKDIEVIWIQGPSGVGKSKKVVEICEEKGIEEFDEVKHDNNHGFWLECDGTGCAVYDDFRDSDMKASEFVNFIDYNVHNLRIIGGSVRNHYNTIIITTVQRLDKIYKNMKLEEPRQQWMRRVKVIDMYPDDNDEDVWEHATD